ncbi:MarR family EPS-associated transcriptional regulator [Sulfitobacter sp. JB4-11]|uniref:MarR family EPS-associated transcriptional regulator n=1 Tax=Sulfitobacter rhodophyticola TaxID=3238304 RepID=UPI0035118272
MRTLPASHQDSLHLQVMRVLQENPEQSQRELARSAGISLGSVNYVLKALVAKGLVKLGNFSANPDKRRYTYILTPKGIAEKTALTHRFLHRKRAEYEALRAEIEMLSDEIGEAWE